MGPTSRAWGCGLRWARPAGRSWGPRVCGASRWGGPGRQSRGGGLWERGAQAAQRFRAAKHKGHSGPSQEHKRYSRSPLRSHHLIKPKGRAGGGLGPGRAGAGRPEQLRLRFQRPGLIRGPITPSKAAEWRPHRHAEGSLTGLGAASCPCPHHLSCGAQGSALPGLQVSGGHHRRHQE